MAYTTINKSSDFFNTKLYTGNGSTNAITGVGFQPDWNWIKCRSHADSSQIFDVLRTTYALRSDGTNAEAVGNGWTSLDSDGFTLNGDSSGGNVNNSGRTYASWNWKAGTTSGITTDGNTTITPSNYSFNQTSGFSILSYTGNGVEGAKLAHGLGTTPAMVIIKRYSTTGDWVVYHKNLSATKSVFLNYTDAETARAPNGYIYSPDDTNITLSNHGDVNTNGTTTIAYCFAEKTGYSKFGSYVGNGSSSSPTFIYTGFKPKFVMVKNTSQADSWFIHDDKRDGYNDDNEYLFADSSNAEGSNVNRIRLLSNGFSVPTTDKSHNVSGNSYIYMAFGQSIVGSNNVPAVAR